MLSHTNNISDASQQFGKIASKPQRKIVKKQNFKIYISTNCFGGISRELMLL